MNCIAIDDEPLALDLMEEYIKKIPFLNLVAKCSNAFEAIPILQKEKIDVLFLDIQMPDINGIQFLKTLKNQPIIIFTTAYDKYAVEGYNLDVLDYLVKPIPFERFVKAVNKAQEYYNQKNNFSLHLNTLENKEKIEHPFLFVKADYEMVKINFKDILYIEGLKDYIKIYAGDKPILTLQSLKFMEEKLPKKKFFRVHRSYIISLDKINSVQKRNIKIGEKEIPIGDLYKEDFFNMLTDFNL
ncbi:MAG: LytTR family DNA-binding domain-containing protein [Bacteroidia bacterium]